MGSDRESVYARTVPKSIYGGNSFRPIFFDKNTEESGLRRLPMHPGKPEKTGISVFSFPVIKKTSKMKNLPKCPGAKANKKLKLTTLKVP